MFRGTELQEKLPRKRYIQWGNKRLLPSLSVLLFPVCNLGAAEATEIAAKPPRSVWQAKNGADYPHFAGSGKHSGTAQEGPGGSGSGRGIDYEILMVDDDSQDGIRHRSRDQQGRSSPALACEEREIGRGCAWVDAYRCGNRGSEGCGFAASA
jgi:hypothetical protein